METMNRAIEDVAAYRDLMRKVEGDAPVTMNRALSTEVDEWNKEVERKNAGSGTRSLDPEMSGWRRWLFCKLVNDELDRPGGLDRLIDVVHDAYAAKWSEDTPATIRMAMRSSLERSLFPDE